MTGKISMDKIIEKSAKKKILFVVSNGNIHKDFLKSFCEFSVHSRNKFEIVLHFCKENEQYMDILTVFSEQGLSDVVVFVHPSIGFSAESIYDLFDITIESNKIVGICSPEITTDFSKINEKNVKYAEILSKTYNVNFKDKNIIVDEKGHMNVRGFKLTDIVAISLKASRSGDKPINISRGFKDMKQECVLLTKHKVSINGVQGCFLEYLQVLQQIRSM